MKITKTKLKEIIKEELNEMEGIMGRPAARPGDVVHVQDILDQLAKALTGDPALRDAQKDFVRALNNAGWEDLRVGDEKHREPIPADKPFKPEHAGWSAQVGGQTVYAKENKQ